MRTTLTKRQKRASRRRALQRRIFKPSSRNGAHWYMSVSPERALDLNVAQKLRGQRGRHVDSKPRRLGLLAAMMRTIRSQGAS